VNDAGRGGGAGGTAGSTSSTGGAGVTSYITGQAVTYSRGAAPNNGNGFGAANTGYGGSNSNGNTGSAGGSGIVIFRYPVSSGLYPQFSAGCTAQVTQVINDYVCIVTATSTGSETVTFI
jgi:hypothetical protein